MKAVLENKPKSQISTWRGWYAHWQQQRELLIDRLGGKCKRCGKTHRLEIDHVNGRNYVLKDISYSRRVRNYLDEEKRGIRLQVLCRSCNAKKQ